MIGWGCGWDMSCSEYSCRGGILSRWLGDEGRGIIGEDLAEVGWSVEVDSAGVFYELKCHWYSFVFCRF